MKSSAIPRAPAAIIRPGKIAVILETLRAEIAAGRYAVGGRLPTEVELTRRFQVSRPTAASALNELERLGLVERIAGSGSYVKEAAPEAAKCAGKVFGLLIPGLGRTEIFEPICVRMAACADAAGGTLLWGGCEAGSREGMRRLADTYLQRRVHGVFFAPLELHPEQAQCNQEILECFQDAGIPVVLLDRDVWPEPRRSAHDLVGVDHFQAGWSLGRHLLECGCRRIFFQVRPFAAPTFEARVAGCRLALRQGELPEDALSLWVVDPAAPEWIHTLKRVGPDAVICSNDANAVALMRALERHGGGLPGLKIAGFDDVSYAEHLSVPLTTVRQPCAAIGEAAFEAMRDRLAAPELAPRSILLTGDLIVRASTASGQLV